MRYALATIILLSSIISEGDDPAFMQPYAVSRLLEITGRAKSVELVEIYPAKLSLLEFTRDPVSKRFKEADLFDGYPILSKRLITLDTWKDLFKKQILEKTQPQKLGLNFRPTLVAKIEGDDGKLSLLKIDLELMVGRVEIGDMKEIFDLTPGFVASIKKQLAEKDH